MDSHKQKTPTSQLLPKVNAYVDRYWNSDLVSLEFIDPTIDPQTWQQTNKQNVQSTTTAARSSTTTTTTEQIQNLVSMGFDRKAAEESLKETGDLEMAIVKPKKKNWGFLTLGQHQCVEQISNFIGNAIV